MSVCGSTCKYIGLIFNRNYRSASNAAISYIQPRPKYLLRKEINGIISRNIYLASTNYAKVSFNLTDIGEGIKEVVVKEWFVNVGDKVSQFDNICEVQSDKASVTITSRYDGVIAKLYYEIDATAKVGQPLIDIETEAVEDEKPSRSEPPTETQPRDDTKKDEIVTEKESRTSKVDDSKKKLCIPSVRRLCKEHNVNLEDVEGTGKGGRVLKEDVLRFLDASKSRTSRATAASRTDRIEPIRGFKMGMMKTMTDALKIPHFTYCDEIAVTKLSAIRKSLKRSAEEAGAKLTFMPFFIKAASNALHKYPILNASLDENCENIIYKSSHNVAVAMNTPAGLAVPVVKNVENLSILEIAKELNRLMLTGKKGNFATADLSGGTFTLSNIGNIGGTVTSPVILPPQVAIVGIGAVKVLPRFDSSMNVVAEEIVNVSGCADHRIVDGATMAEFINLIKKQLENPYLMLL